MPQFIRVCGVIFLGGLVISAFGFISRAQTSPSSPLSPDARQTAPRKKADAAKPCALPGVPTQHMQEVIDATGKLPAPLSADAMINIANKVAPQCPGMAKDLLQRAFDQAEGVEPATALMLTTGQGLSTDSRLFFEKKTYDLAMDRLSLQSRAVMAMASLDAKKAIQLFRQIATPPPSAATCARGFALNVSIYYDALGKVFALQKAQKPHNDAEAQAPFLQLEEVVNNTTSPVQLAPLAKVLHGANLSPNELLSLLNALAATVENFPVDDSSFYYWHSYPSVKAKDQLLQAANKSLRQHFCVRLTDILIAV